jgi:hypothetical protein
MNPSREILETRNVVTVGYLINIIIYRRSLITVYKSIIAVYEGVTTI